MKEYLNIYILETKKLLKGNITNNDITNHLNKIQFFQHERLIHLLVMLFCIFMLIVFIVLSFYSYYFMIVAFIMAVIVIFYILHYYFLENSVQLLYKLYDEMKNKVK